MKKIYVLITTMVMVCFMFGGCYMDGRGTYYPDVTEMTKNLESKGYTVNTDKIKKDDETITVLNGKNGDEYIEFFWFGTDKYVDEYVEEMKKAHSGYDTLSSVKNSEEYGDIAYCATKKALDRSGIQVVEVK